MSELCPKCQVPLAPVNLRSRFSTGRDQYDGTNAKLADKGIVKVSSVEGFTCSSCHDVFGWNGEIKPLRLSLLSPEMRDGVHLVEIWRIDRPINWPKPIEPVQTEFFLD